MSDKFAAVKRDGQLSLLRAGWLNSGKMDSFRHRHPGRAQPFLCIRVVRFEPQYFLELSDGFVQQPILDKRNVKVVVSAWIIARLWQLDHFFPSSGAAAR
jgi:hypothetical protein